MQVRVIDVAKGYQSEVTKSSNYAHHNGSGNNFTTYVIQVNEPQGRSSQVRHRYSDFELLRAYLSRQYPYSVIPPIPEKQTLLEALGSLAKAPLTLGRPGSDPETVTRRKRMLESFLGRVMRKKSLQDDLAVRAFLGLEESINWRDTAIISPTQYDIDYSIVSVDLAAKKYNVGVVCCVERSLIDLEASIIAFGSVLAQLESKLKKQIGKIKEYHEDMREIGTSLNGFSVEYEALSRELEVSGEKVDKETKVIEAQILRSLEPQIDRVHEGVQLCEVMRRTLCNLIGLLVQLNSLSQRLHNKRAELLQKESDGIEQELLSALNEEIYQMENDRQRKQEEVDQLKQKCLEDIRQTEWDLADDMRDIMRIIASSFYEYRKEEALVVEKMPTLFLFFLLSDLISTASISTSKFLFLHSTIASVGQVNSKEEKTQVSVEISVNGSAMEYLCKAAIINRIALHNTNKFARYLREVHDGPSLLVYLQSTSSLVREDISTVMMFLKDVFLLVAVLECKEIVNEEQRLQILGRLVSLVGEYIWENRPRIKVHYQFAIIDDSIESDDLKVLPFSAPLFSDAVSVENVQRLLHLIETFYPNSYDLSALCKYLDAPTKSTVYEDARSNYLKRRVKEECLSCYVTSSRHSFGYVFMLHDRFPQSSLVCNTLMILDQMTFQLNYLFSKSKSSSRITTKTAVEFAESKKDPKLAKYLNKWLHLWSIAFEYGVTEVIDYQVLPNNFQTIRRKLDLLLSYYRDEKCKLKGLLRLIDLLIVFL